MIKEGGEFVPGHLLGKPLGEDLEPTRGRGAAGTATDEDRAAGAQDVPVDGGGAQKAAWIEGPGGQPQSPHAGT